MTGRTRAGFVGGLALFVVGAVIAGYFTLRDSGSGDGGPTTQVLMAAKTIPAGTTGSNAAAQGLVDQRSVPTSAAPADALTDVAQLAGKIAIGTVREGQILTGGQFPAAQTRIGTVRLPPNRSALALQLENVPGVAGFAGAGDRIDIYSVVRDGEGADRGVRLVMQGVEVLNVNGTTLAPVQGQPGGPGLVFLLSVTKAEAERLIYLSSFERLHFTLISEEQSPAPTPGARPADALNPA